LAGLLYLSKALFCDLEIPLCPAPAFWSGVAEAGRNQALSFQPFEGRIYTSYRNASSTALFKFLGNRNSVGIVTQMDQGEDNHQFKLS
jgi:hypothetical protein